VIDRDTPGCAEILLGRPGSSFAASFIDIDAVIARPRGEP